MNFEQFTLKAQQSVQRAQQIAMSMGHGSIEGLHLLKGILEEDDRILPFILKKFNTTQDPLRRARSKFPPPTTGEETAGAGFPSSGVEIPRSPRGFAVTSNTKNARTTTLVAIATLRAMRELRIEGLT